MSIYAHFDNDEQRQIASNQGWSDLCAWADSLDESQFPEIVHLCDNGYESQLEALEQQLAAAVAASPPSADVAHTVELLTDALAVRGSTDTLFVTNGMTSDDGEGEPPPANA